jgi:hypothetical protein
MHLTEKGYQKLPHYIDYHTSHSAGTTPGGTSVLITNVIKRYQLNNYSEDFLQATNGSVEDSVGLSAIPDVYIPPRKTAKQE